MSKVIEELQQISDQLDKIAFAQLVIARNAVAMMSDNFEVQLRDEIDRMLSDIINP